MRSVSAGLAAAQIADKRRPYFNMYFDLTNYGNRVMAIDHQEWPYETTATIYLNNYDGAIGDLTGNNLHIGYGDIISPTESYAADTPRLWVKKQYETVSDGQRYMVVYLEGMWEKLREKTILEGDNWKYQKTWDRTTSVYDLLLHYIDYAGFNLLASHTNDGILDDFKPHFAVNKCMDTSLPPWESCYEVIYPLICMTKSYLRALPNDSFYLVYPQTSDSADITYYKTQSPYYYECYGVKSLVLPNTIIATCNQNEETGSWSNIILGSAVDSDSVSRYGTVQQVIPAPYINNQTDANNRAASFLARIRAESSTTSLVIPHDCRIELYDYVQANDGVTTYPQHPLSRVSGLRHYYDRLQGIYRLTIYMGGLSDLPRMPYSESNPIEPGRSWEEANPNYWANYGRQTNPYPIPGDQTQKSAGNIYNAEPEIEDPDDYPMSPGYRGPGGV